MMIPAFRAPGMGDGGLEEEDGVLAGEILNEGRPPLGTSGRENLQLKKSM